MSDEMHINCLPFASPFGLRRAPFRANTASPSEIYFLLKRLYANAEPSQKHPPPPAEVEKQRGVFASLRRTMRDVFPSPPSFLRDVAATSAVEGVPLAAEMRRLFATVFVEGIKFQMIRGEFVGLPLISRLFGWYERRTFDARGCLNALALGLTTALFALVLGANGASVRAGLYLLGNVAAGRDRSEGIVFDVRLFEFAFIEHDGKDCVIYSALKGLLALLSLIVGAIICAAALLAMRWHGARRHIAPIRFFNGVNVHIVALVLFSATCAVIIAPWLPNPTITPPPSKECQIKLPPQDFAALAADNPALTFRFDRRTLHLLLSVAVWGLAVFGFLIPTYAARIGLAAMAAIVPALTFFAAQLTVAQDVAQAWLLLALGGLVFGIAPIVWLRTQGAWFAMELARSEALFLARGALEEMLPATIATRLVEADDDPDVSRLFYSAHPQCAILFASSFTYREHLHFTAMDDFSGFSERLPPHRTVALLAEVFKIFDDASREFGAHKLDAIGSARGFDLISPGSSYVCAIGLDPERTRDSVGAALRLAVAASGALRILDASELTNSPFSVSVKTLRFRFGLHLGPVAGGVRWLSGSLMAQILTAGVPRYHLVGQTVRAAREVVEACPLDFIGLSNEFFKAVPQQLRELPFIGDAVRGQHELAVTSQEDSLVILDTRDVERATC